jgi:hypothetical protein
LPFYCQSDSGLHLQICRACIVFAVNTRDALCLSRILSGIS